MSESDEYINDVIDGKVTVCRSVRLAVEREVRDRANSKHKDFPYYFDADIADAICSYFPVALNHSIGKHAGSPFVLEPWQKFCLSSIFGWKRKDNHCRRFRRVYWSMGRKNGKSSIAAGIAMLMASIDINPYTNDAEARAQVILAATKREQVEKVVMAECCRMREQSPLIKEGSIYQNKIIRFNHNGGNISCVGSDRPFDGLNPVLCVLDETHAWRKIHQPFYSTMQTGSGSRAQPIILTITTAGDDRSHIWLEEVNYAKQVLEQAVEDDSIFVACYELDDKDDPLDPSVWIKANPNIGVSVSEDFLEQQAKQAATSVTAMNRFKRYHCNVLVSSTEHIFDLEHFSKCNKPLSDWSKADAVSFGCDLGGRDDLCAYSAVARFATNDSEDDGTPIYRYESRTQAYISASTKRDLRQKPFCDLIEDGFISVTNTPIADLQADLIEDYWKYNGTDVAIDPYQAQQFGEQCTQQGLQIATMAQTTAHFNQPISIFRQACADENFVHDNDLLLKWCLSNAVAVRDRSDRYMLDKASSSQKIDPLVACLMALARATAAPVRGKGDFYVT